MKLSVDFGRWTAMKAALAGALALAIGGAVGSAVAISPTIAPPIKWGGGWEANAYNVTGPYEFGVVPAGRSLMVTDVVAANFTAQPSQFFLLQGNADCQNGLTNRMPGVVVPAYGTVHLPLATGVGFAAGKRVCASTGGFLNFSFRGFYFTAATAPAS